MLSRNFVFLGLCLVLVFAVLPEAGAKRGRGRKTKEEKADKGRSGKLFSLFNVVQFENAGCRSTARSSGAASGSAYRNGTCYTTSECRDRRGEAAGSCAAGFGVCCVFVISDTGRTVNQNCSYIQNPNFPNTYTGTSTISYTINKCSEDVCSIRLDFESFTILGTSETSEIKDTQDCEDTMTFMTSTAASVPTICGKNTGQHMYLDVGRQPSDSVSLAMSFNGDSNARTWDIKVTQVKCTDELLPPEGCLQYHVSTSGRLQTFNFMSSDETHLPLQDYNVCIRQEQGMCCVQYQACADTSAMTLATLPNGKKEVAGTDTECSGDYVYIEDSGFQCDNPINQATSNNRYCGPVFGPSRAEQLKTNARVCDCSLPFMVGIHTDDMSDAGDTKTPNTILSRGTCLTFMQLPC